LENFHRVPHPCTKRTHWDLAFQIGTDLINWATVDLYESEGVREGESQRVRERGSESERVREWESERTRESEKADPSVSHSLNLISALYNSQRLLRRSPAWKFLFHALSHPTKTHIVDAVRELTRQKSASVLALSLSDFLTFSLSHSLTFSLSRALSLSLSHSLTLSLSHALALSLTLSRSHSLTLTLSLSHSLALSLPHSLTLALSHSLALSLSHFLTLSLSLSLSLSHSLTLDLFRSLALALALSHSLTLSLSHSLTLSLSLSLSLTFSRSHSRFLVFLNWILWFIVRAALQSWDDPSRNWRESRTFGPPDARLRNSRRIWRGLKWFRGETDIQTSASSAFKIIKNKTFPFVLKKFVSFESFQPTLSKTKRGKNSGKPADLDRISDFPLNCDSFV